MEWIRLLQEAINYIEDHLLDKINYEDVARHSYMSSYNFHRMFSLMTDMTANEYIRNRRLSAAGDELQTTDISVIDAAFKYGYETPESFSKAFSRFHGVTPKQAKQKGTTLHMFNPLVLKIIFEGGTIMDYRIEHKEKQKFIALVRSFSNETINDSGSNGVPEFWDECNKKNLVEKLRCLRPNGKKDLYGLCSPTKGSNLTFDYGIGVIIDEDTDTNELKKLCEQGYVLWETTPIDYAVFKCIGNNGDCISETWSKFFKEFIPQSSYEHTDNTDYEIYFEKGPKDLFCEIWIPVRKK